MAVPSNPTVTTIVTAGLKQGGVPSPSQSQISEMTNDGFQNVKTEIWLANKTDKILETRAMVTLAKGTSSITLPTDFDHPVELVGYTGPTDYQGTASAGTTTSITLASSFSNDEAAILGLYIFILSGTGSGQFAQITAYNNTTKVATLTTLTTAPSSNSVYMIANEWWEIKEDALVHLIESNGKPKHYRWDGTEILITPAPDTIYYALLLRYGPNLTRLDEAGTAFVKHLRERRALWIQGVKVQTLIRYDDARLPAEDARWKLMLTVYGGHNLNYAQAAPVTFNQNLTVR